MPSADPAAWWALVSELSRQYEDAMTAAGGGPRTARRYLSVDASGVYALSSADCFADAVGRAAELGFTDVVTRWPRPDGPYAGRESVLETVAATYLPGGAR
jgi:hypothetical protein